MRTFLDTSGSGTRLRSYLMPGSITGLSGLGSDLLGGLLRPWLYYDVLRLSGALGHRASAGCCRVHPLPFPKLLTMQALPYPSAEAAAHASALASYNSARSAILNHPAWGIETAIPIRDWGQSFLNSWVSCRPIVFFVAFDSCRPK